MLECLCIYMNIGRFDPCPRSSPKKQCDCRGCYYQQRLLKVKNGKFQWILIHKFGIKFKTIDTKKLLEYLFFHCLLSDVSKIKNVHKHKAPIKTALEKKVDEAKRTRNYLDKMEVAFKFNLICRSAGFEGSLDVNVNRNLSTASFDANLLESLGVNIISGIL